MTSEYNMEEIKICLQNTFSSGDKNIRTQSEKRLEELKNKNIFNFSSELIKLFKLSNSENDYNLRLSIIINLKRSIQEKIESNKINEETNNQLIQLFLPIIVDPNLSDKELENLKEAFKFLINNSNSQVLLELVNYIKGQIYQMPLGSVSGVVAILYSIILSSNIKKDIFLKILEDILNIISLNTNSLYSKYQNLTLKDNLNDYINLNKIFKNIFEFMFQICKKAIKLYKIKEKKLNDIFYNISITAIKILVDTKNQYRIISWTGDKNIDKNINSMKISIIKFINIQILSFGDIIVDKDKTETHAQLIKIVISNLEWIIMNQYNYLIKLESHEKYPDYYYSLLISFMNIYLRRILSKENFIQEYTNYFNILYKNMFLPFLLITELQEEIAYDDSSVNGYIIDINDIIYNNKEKSIKSTTALIIKIFFEKNIGANKFIIQYTIGLLNYIINNYNLNDKNIFNQNDIIIQSLKVYPKEKIISLLFLALNIISTTKQNSNTMNNDNIISHFFENSFSNISNLLNYPILKHQIILFIRNYYIRFYDINSQKFENAMETLFQFLFEEKYLLISNSAAEAIQSLFNQKNKLSVALKDVLLQVSLKMTSLFEQKILEIQINNFFDVLYDILLCFEGGDNNFFKAIFKNLCKRVNMQVERHFRLKFKVKKETNKLKQKAISQTNLNSYKIIVNKCFNLIRLLMDNEIFVIKNLDLIEESLKPLVDYMENPNKIDFDEDLVAVIYLIIKYNKKVTGLCFSIIKNLYKYCDKLKGLYPDTYKLVNAYLAYGTDQILSNKVWYEGIFKVFNSGIKREERTNKSVLFTCILIQTWIMNCNKLPNDLLKELLDKIIKSICNIVQIYNKNNELNEEMYNYVGYVSTVMSAFINYSPLIISYRK